MGLINSKPKQNLIINGDMRIAQRGTSFASMASNTYSLDRWQYSKIGSMVHTVSQSSDAPTDSQSGYQFLSSLDSTITTAQASIGVNDENFIRQSIEGFNFSQIARQKPFTLSFWVKATVTGTYCVAFRNSGNDRSYIAEYVVNSSNTWEFKTITVSSPSPSAGTWDYSNGIGLQVLFVMAAGTNRQTTPGAWQTGNFISTSNQVNAAGTISNSFRITGISLNEGSSAQPFRLFGNTINAELEACLRYYERHTGVLGLAFDNANSTTAGQVIWQYKVKKRSNSINSVGSSVATNSRYYGPSGLKGVNTFVTAGISNLDSGGFTVTIASAAVQYQGGTIAIIGNSSTDYLDADSEL